MSGKMVEIEVPLNWNLSKNKKFVGRTKKVLNPLYKQCKNEIALLLSKHPLDFKKEKIYVYILVTKKNLRGDCSNLIEGIFDAIKTQIGVDDNYYSVLCDWEIGKVESVFIRITQKEDEWK